MVYGIKAMAEETYFCNSTFVVNAKTITCSIVLIRNCVVIACHSELDWEYSEMLFISWLHSLKIAFNLNFCVFSLLHSVRMNDSVEQPLNGMLELLSF